MNHRRDADRVLALLDVLTKLANRALGVATERVFGWDAERTFKAIDWALEHGLIERAS